MRRCGSLRRIGRLKDDSVFVDVGANIGTQTVHALRAGPFSRAVAFEPEKRNAKLLNMNLAANDMTARTTVFAKAAGATDGEARLFLHPRNKGAHAIDSQPSPDTVKSVVVPVTRLDTALRALNLQAEEIGLIWIDVEGAEAETVRGPRRSGRQNPARDRICAGAAAAGQRRAAHHSGEALSEPASPRDGEPRRGADCQSRARLQHDRHPVLLSG